MAIFAANWKLNKNPEQTKNFFTVFLEKLKPSNDQIIFFPSSPCWGMCEQSLKGSAVSWGAQNVYFQNSGAFTGEVSPQTLAEMGGKFALVGHSERRQLFHEGDEFLSMKVAALQALSVTPILCIGESLSQREKNETGQVLHTQLEKGLEKANKDKPLIIAYEPVWAIGTGKVATPEQVAAAHLVIHQKLRQLGFGSNQNSVPILYGGSVKPDNSSSLLRIPHVEGFLVGGASLEVDSFLAICKASNHA